jgi:hypothetical protein
MLLDTSWEQRCSSSRSTASKSCTLATTVAKKIDTSWRRKSRSQMSIFSFPRALLASGSTRVVACVSKNSRNMFIRSWREEANACFLSFRLAALSNYCSFWMNTGSKNQKNCRTSRSTIRFPLSINAETSTRPTLTCFLKRYAKDFTRNKYFFVHSGQPI